MIKPVKRSERVPLQKMDVLAKHAFDDLLLDIIGRDLPRTRSGNRYILAVICNVNKWPTIIPLKDLKAETVAEKLLELCSFSGLPRVIRSDNFASSRGDLMTTLRTKLGIEGKFSAPFHPISHGSVERLNSTVESVLRKMLIEKPND